MSGNWEEFGEKIRRTVQEAVDNQEYEKLNQVISDTIEQATNAVSSGIKKVKESSESSKKDKKVTYQKSDSNLYDTKEKKVSSQRADSKIHYTNVKNETDIVKQKQWVRIPSKKMAVLWSVFGYALGGIGLASGLLLGLAAWMLDGILGLGVVVLIKFLGFLSMILTGSGFCVGFLQTKKLSRIKRVNHYMKVIGKKEYCNISDLICQTGLAEKTIRKDLSYMIRKKWFFQGHLDRQETCLILTDHLYEQYRRLEQQRVLEEKEKVSKEKVVREKNAKESERSKEKLSPEIRKVIDQGDEYIRKIRACNDAIPGQEISEKIDRIEMLVDKIFDRVEKEPKYISDIKKLMDYYLPTTVKLLEAYAEMDAQPIGGENIQASKKEIEATLDTLNVAFEKLLDSLFQETAWDVSSDISVLNTILAQEGLKEDGLKKTN